MSCMDEVFGKDTAMSPAARILRRDRLGGLIHEYAQIA
jgi:hypothetical protein